MVVGPGILPYHVLGYTASKTQFSVLKSRLDVS